MSNEIQYDTEALAEQELFNRRVEQSSSHIAPVLSHDQASETAEAGLEEQLEQEDDNGGAFANVGQGLKGQYKRMMMQYWQEIINLIERDEHDFKNHQLPLARIKKVMKTDEAVKMISAEAPILFAKGCDIFITELTMRAWIHAEENKRRTLQKSDICAALQKSDMFDFLIDIVPRDKDKPKKQGTVGANGLDIPGYTGFYGKDNKQKYQPYIGHSSATTLNSLTSQTLASNPVADKNLQGNYMGLEFYNGDVKQEPSVKATGNGESSNSNGQFEINNYEF